MTAKQYIEKHFSGSAKRKALKNLGNNQCNGIPETCPLAPDDDLRALFNWSDTEEGAIYWAEHCIRIAKESKRA